MHRVHVYYDRWPQLADVLREHADPERSTDEYAAMTSEQWRAISPKPGDRVHRVVKLLGGRQIARFWTWATGRPCGCDARRRWLNRLWSR